MSTHRPRPTSVEFDALRDPFDALTEPVAFHSKNYSENDIEQEIDAAVLSLWHREPLETTLALIGDRHPATEPVRARLSGLYATLSGAA